MDPARWKEIERLYNSALDLEPELRKAFLETACAQDSSLLREVNRLIEHHEEAEAFLKSPAMEVLTGADPEKRPSMLGRKLGSYKIISELGKGGMGEVYRAKDLKLGRNVAIKVLPEEFTGDSDRIARFNREARLLAALNHPNIAGIHGLEETEGVRFLVLELVEGQTLADRLKHGPIPIEESLKLALQIAEALEAAHEKGIIHRDLKPANVKLTPDDKVKVLDFGLARVFAGDQEERILSDSQTLSAETTRKGMILGTAAYMSPEQAKGKVVDKKADIWAFGAVLFEMLAGRTAFSGEGISDILAAVIRAEPAWNCLPAGLHGRLREVLERCLEKESRNRYHNIADVRLDIGKVLDDPRGMLTMPRTAPAFFAKLPWTIPFLTSFVILSALTIGFVLWILKPIPESGQVIKFDTDMPGIRLFFRSSAVDLSLAIAPDGSKYVWSAKEGLYLRSMNEMDARLIPGSDLNTQSPFFSPDGQWIGYFSETDLELKKIKINGGSPEPLCTANLVFGAVWEDDNTIVYSDVDRGILRISASGGTPETLAKGKLCFPQLLSDGKLLMFTDVALGTPTRIMVQSLESGERKELFEGSAARYLSTGHLVYLKDNNLMAVQFDPVTLETTGEAVSAIEGVMGGLFSISDSGTIIYMTGTTISLMPLNTLIWVDRDGNEEDLPAPPNLYGNFNLSPHDTRLAFANPSEGINLDIYVWDFVREISERLTTNGAMDGTPLWSPDGKQIFFLSDRGKKYGVYCRVADRTKPVEPVGSLPEHACGPRSWSKDGKTLVLQTLSEHPTQHDIWIWSIEGDREKKALLHEEYNESFPQVSPDGKWLAYQSDESGIYEIYVSSFPEVSKYRFQISNGGGVFPRWSPNGRELFYRNGDAFIGVRMRTEPTFKSDKPEILFHVPDGDVETTWDISHDGKRFLMAKPYKKSDEESATDAPRKINVIINWFEELKKLVPSP